MLAEVEANFPGTRVLAVNGKPVNPSIRVADLVDDLDAIYAVDNSKAAVAKREEWRKNQLFVDVMLKQKHLKE